MRGAGMDQLHEFLEAVRKHEAASRNLLGLLHILIGRRVASADGVLVSSGMTWRNLAALLKRERWETETVRELGIDPDDLPPRDRYRFWYTAINQAHVDSAEAVAAGNKLASTIHDLGYVVGPAPGVGAPSDAAEMPSRTKRKKE